MYLRESRRTRGGACPLGWSVSSALGSMKVWVIRDDLLCRADNSHARSRNGRKRLRCMCKMLVRSSAIWEGEKIKAATIISGNTFLPRFAFIPFQACPPSCLGKLSSFGGICKYLGLKEARLRSVSQSEVSFFPFPHGTVQIPTLGWAVGTTDS